MLQVFYINVAKVDQDVAQVAIDIHVCFKCMLQMFHLFHTYVASVSFGCCIYIQVFQVFSYVCCMCFILMFVMATHVFLSFFPVFSSVSDI